MPEELTTIPPPTAEALIQHAIDKNVPVETMERLLAMRTQLKAEAAQEAYVNALAEFQKECPIIDKPKSVRNRDGTHRYNFAPLDYIVCTVRELIAKHGFSYSFDTATKPTAVCATCNVTHALGHSKPSTFECPVDAAPGMNRMQANASALSYAKRYAFCNAFGIQTGEEDDDANSTTEDNSARARLRRRQAAMGQEPRERPAQEAEIVHRGPEEDDPPAKPEPPVVNETLDSVLADLLLKIHDATDGAELTQCIEEGQSLDNATEKNAAKMAINARAAALGLKWSNASKQFITK